MWRLARKERRYACGVLNATAFGADLVLKGQPPTEAELPLLKHGAVLVGMLDPVNHGALEATLLASEGRTAAAEAVGRPRLRGCRK